MLALQCQPIANREEEHQKDSLVQCLGLRKARAVRKISFATPALREGETGTKNLYSTLDSNNKKMNF